ncbi:MAG: malonic semialdehyde reductase [Actinomycetaceae bacterium]|nr:malonic semialdehyde reductase [Actinomycetaceae bacterium]
MNESTANGTNERNIPAVNDDALAALFTSARTARTFLAEPAPTEAVRRAYENARWAPTAFNSQPLRLDLLASPQSRQRLVPHMMETNRETVAGAPLTLITSAETAPGQSMRTLGAPERVLDIVSSSPDAGAGLARDSALIQLGYLVVALRAEGLDVGVMTGADMSGVDDEFHRDSSWRTIAIVNVGHAAADAYRPRSGRHEFDAVSRVL